MRAGRGLRHYLEHSLIFEVRNLTHKIKWPSHKLEPRPLFSWPRLHRSWGITNKPSCIKGDSGLKVRDYNNLMTISLGILNVNLCLLLFWPFSEEHNGTRKYSLRLLRDADFFFPPRHLLHSRTWMPKVPSRSKMPVSVRNVLSSPWGPFKKLRTERPSYCFGLSISSVSFLVSSPFFLSHSPTLEEGGKDILLEGRDLYHIDPSSM